MLKIGTAGFIAGAKGELRVLLAYSEYASTHFCAKMALLVNNDGR